MKHLVAQIHPADNVLVALVDLPIGTPVAAGGATVTTTAAIPAKHKLALRPLAPGDAVTMYGVLVGRMRQPLAQGGLLTTANLRHATDGYAGPAARAPWTAPNVAAWAGRTFRGYHRADGRVGTANHWLVVPLVFCENRNIQVLREALVDDLGYGRRRGYQGHTQTLIALLRAGKSVEEILRADLPAAGAGAPAPPRLFPNVDGVHFLTHAGGCGGTRQDAQALCGLLAGYITHPNVAGATVLSLGCQNAQVSMLREEIRRRDPHFDKPLFILEQQQLGTEEALVGQALRQTFAGLMRANEQRRRPAPLSKLTLGLECGGSDGFSGISANPAVGHAADSVVALGGAVILAEFPELCGVEQEIVNRAVSPGVAHRFTALMRA